MRTEHDVGQWLWRHGELTWITTGTLAMEAYSLALVSEQQRAAPSDPDDDEAIVVGDLRARLTDVPGYRHVDAPLADALDGLAVTPFGACARHAYIGFPRPVDALDVPPAEGDLQLAVAEIGGLCRDGGYFEDLATRMASVGIVEAELGSVAVMRSPTEVFRFEDDRVVHLTGTEAAMARMQPFLERFVADRPSNPITDDLSELPIPTCLFRDPDGAGLPDEQREAFVTDCATPHQGELYHHGLIAGDAGSPYQGDEQIAAEAERQCLDVFAAYVGTSWEASSLGLLYYYPSPDSWREGDRIVHCVLYAGDGEQLVRGSFAGSGQ